LLNPIGNRREVEGARSFLSLPSITPSIPWEGGGARSSRRRASFTPKKMGGLCRLTRELTGRIPRDGEDLRSRSRRPHTIIPPDHPCVCFIETISRVIRAKHRASIERGIENLSSRRASAFPKISHSLRRQLSNEKSNEDVTRMYSVYTVFLPSVSLSLSLSFRPFDPRLILVSFHLLAGRARWRDLLSLPNLSLRDDDHRDASTGTR